MSTTLVIRNQQRALRVDLRHLRLLTTGLLREFPGVEECELGIFLVRAERMSQLNRTHLGHEGSTDVITFNYQDENVSPEIPPRRLHGELFICVDEAVAQGARFRTTWMSELARYVIHGVLHLLGYDDLEPSARRRMKRMENRLLNRVRQTFGIDKLAHARPIPAQPPIKSRGRKRCQKPRAAIHD